MLTNRATQIEEVQSFYASKGVSQATSLEIATELMQKKPLETIISVKYGLELGHYMNPWDAAFSSFISAALGGVFPLLAIIILPSNWKMIGTIIAVSIAVALTAFISSKLGDGKIKVAIIRNIIIGFITMLIHYGIGQFF